jgi:hypothetical protein
MGYIAMKHIPSIMLHNFSVVKPKKKFPTGPRLARNSISTLAIKAVPAKAIVW